MNQIFRNDIDKLERELIKAAQYQDNYDLNTINLIAPASPTPLKYFYDIPLRHNAIAEGLLNNRPYAGVMGFNKIEEIATKIACCLFNAEHANVQPHSVSQANQAVYQGLLENGDKVLAMDFSAGGHLTHGLKINFSGRFFNFKFYGVDYQGFIDYRNIEQIALKFRPKLIVCGASSYPRNISFKKLKSICKRVNAYLLADVSHPAGLIVAKKFPQPFPYCDVVTLTLDKTMLGPHGGIILCRKNVSDIIDKAVHPGTQSSVPLRRIYQMAMCLLDCARPKFNKYINRILDNTKTFVKEFSSYKDLMVTNGSDTHLIVLDTYKIFGLTGKESEKLLEDVGILTNRQVVPGEIFKPYVASGIRLGTSWITARGYTQSDCRTIAKTIINVLSQPTNQTVSCEAKRQMKSLLRKNRKKDVWFGEKPTL